MWSLSAFTVAKRLPAWSRWKQGRKAALLFNHSSLAASCSRRTSMKTEGRKYALAHGKAPGLSRNVSGVGLIPAWLGGLPGFFGRRTTGRDKKVTLSEESGRPKCLFIYPHDHAAYTPTSGRDRDGVSRFNLILASIAKAHGQEAVLAFSLADWGAPLMAINQYRAGKLHKLRIECTRCARRGHTQIATRLAKTPLSQRQISLCERTRRFPPAIFACVPMK